MKKEKGTIVDEVSVAGNRELCGIALDLIHADNSSSKLMSLATIILAPKERSKLHYHKKMDEMYYFVSGEGRVLLEESWREVRSGTAVFIPKRVIHQIDNTGDVPLKLISVDTPPFDTKDIYYP